MKQIKPEQIQGVINLLRECIAEVKTAYVLDTVSMLQSLPDITPKEGAKKK